MTKLGFGFLRLPLLDKKDEHSVDHAVLNSLVDLFIKKGGRYFDTAYTYLGGARGIMLGFCGIDSKASYSFYPAFPHRKLPI